MIIWEYCRVKKWGNALLFLIISGLLLSACQTGEVFLSPSLSARVQDLNTGAPIENVKVTMWSAEVPEARQNGTSDKNGGVNLPRLKGRLKIALPFIADRLMPRTVVRFETKGYFSKEIYSDVDYPYFTGERPVDLEPSPR